MGLKTVNQYGGEADLILLLILPLYITAQNLFEVLILRKKE